MCESDINKYTHIYIYLYKYTILYTVAYTYIYMYIQGDSFQASRYKHNIPPDLRFCANDLRKSFPRSSVQACRNVPFLPCCALFGCLVLFAVDFPVSWSEIFYNMSLENQTNISQCPALESIICCLFFACNPWILIFRNSEKNRSRHNGLVSRYPSRVRFVV